MASGGRGGWGELVRKIVTAILEAVRQTDRPDGTGGKGSTAGTAPARRRRTRRRTGDGGTTTTAGRSGSGSGSGSRSGSGSGRSGSGSTGSRSGRSGSGRSGSGSTGSGRGGADASGTDGITVGYAPERDGDADPGEVVWTWVPYEDDPSQGKDRPVLVLGWDGPLLAGVQLSSKDHGQRRDADEWVPVGTGGWDREGRPSYADAARLLRIDPAEVRREGAALSRERFDAVVARVEALHHWHR